MDEIVSRVARELREDDDGHEFDDAEYGGDNEFDAEYDADIDEDAPDPPDRAEDEGTESDPNGPVTNPHEEAREAGERAREEAREAGERAHEEARCAREEVRRAGERARRHRRENRSDRREDLAERIERAVEAGLEGVAVTLERHSERMAAEVGPGPTTPCAGIHLSPEDSDDKAVYKTQLQKGGRVAVPEAETETLGLEPGDTLQVVLYPVE